MSHRRRSALFAIVTSLSLALAATVLPSAARAAVSPTPVQTAYSMNGNPGNWLLGSGASTETGTDVTITPTTTSIEFRTTASYYARVSPGTSGALTTGTFTANSGQNTQVEVNFSAPGRGCSTFPGTVTIHEIGRDATGLITSFAASYLVGCDGQPPVSGELRYNSTVDFHQWAPIYAGRPAGTERVTVTAAAGGSTFGQAAIASTRTGAFTIVADTCSNQTIAEGSTCVVDVSAWAVAAGPILGALTLPEPAAAGPRVVSFGIMGRDTAGGAFTSVPGARLLDTRSGVGGLKGRMPSGGTFALQVSGRGGVPGGATAAVLNVTVTSPSTGGYLTIYPTGRTRPVASSINFPGGWTGANLVTVPLGTGGKVSIFNAVGNAHVIVDVVGYYRADALNPGGAQPYGGYHRTTPERIFSSIGHEPLPSGYYFPVAVNYGATNNQAIRALVVNITSTRATGSGYLSAFNGDPSATIGTSTLNYGPGRTVPNMAIVPVSSCAACTPSGIPQIGIFNGGPGSTHVIVDIVGFIDDATVADGARFTALPSPTRIVDTRYGRGTTKLGPLADRVVASPPTVAGWNTAALVSNLTAIRPTASTFLTLYANGNSRPGVSNINPATGQVVANMAVVPVGAANEFRMFNQYGSLDAALDVAGTLEYYPQLPDGVTSADRAAAADARGATGPVRLLDVHPGHAARLR